MTTLIQNSDANLKVNSVEVKKDTTDKKDVTEVKKEVKKEKINDLTNKENKEKFFKERSEAIKNGTDKQKRISNKDFLNIDLDKLNLDDLKNLTKKEIKIEKNQGNKDVLYKFQLNDKLSTDKQKKERMRLRRERNKFLNNIIFYFNENNTSETKKEIKNFIDFYKKEYVKNDVSFESLSANNSDDETKIKIKVVLQLIKKFK